MVQGGPGMPPQMDGGRNGMRFRWKLVISMGHFFRSTNDISRCSNVNNANRTSRSSWWTHATECISTSSYVTIDESTWSKNVYEQFTRSKSITTSSSLSFVLSLGWIFFIITCSICRISKFRSSNFDDCFPRIHVPPVVILQRHQR